MQKDRHEAGTWMGRFASNNEETNPYHLCTNQYPRRFGPYGNWVTFGAAWEQLAGKGGSV